MLKNLGWGKTLSNRLSRTSPPAHPRGHPGGHKRLPLVAAAMLQLAGRPPGRSSWLLTTLLHRGRHKPSYYHFWSRQPWHLHGAHVPRPGGLPTDRRRGGPAASTAPAPHLPHSPRRLLPLPNPLSYGSREPGKSGIWGPKSWFQFQQQQGADQGMLLALFSWAGIQLRTTLPPAFHVTPPTAHCLF